MSQTSEESLAGQEQVREDAAAVEVAAARADVDVDGAEDPRDDAMAAVLSKERAALRQAAQTAASAEVKAPGDKSLGGPGVRRGTSPSALFRSRDPRVHHRPGSREEEWRFTPLDRLGVLLDVEADAHAAVAPSDARVSVDVVSEDPRVEVRRIGPGDAAVGRALVPSDRPTAVAMAGFTEDTGVHVHVPRGVVPDAPVSVVVRGEGGPGAGASFGHLVVEVDETAEAEVVLDHVGSAAWAGNVELLVGDGAHLTVVVLCDWERDAVHLSAQAARLGRDATLKVLHVMLGGDVVRVVPSVQYAGRGGDATLRGIGFADAGQHLEARLFVDHAVPDCRSDVSYKNALSGADAHSVWVGDVLIRAAATGTDTYELNRNLLLTDDARADSVPNLEIETGEIAGAGHASATGRFDDEQVFYLMSRGIGRDEAQRLVVRGFFAESLDGFEIGDVGTRVRQAIDQELEAVGR